MKYKIVKESKALPDGVQVGDTVDVNIHSNDKSLYSIRTYGTVYPLSEGHLHALLELGVVEEVKEWNPRELKDGEQYWVAAYDFEYPHVWYGETSDKYFRALGNCHPTREVAESWRDKLLADYK